MISTEDADRLREQLLAVLVEDAHNSARLLARLSSISQESGIGAHAALLLILTHLAFEEDEARRHWEAILSHREAVSLSLGRDAGIRVALLDYFMNVNRRLVQPALIDLDMYGSDDGDAGTDSLTGMATDRRFRTELQNELRRAKRYNLKVAVVLVDADDFSEVNSKFGALVGDRLLREMAILLHNKIRDIDQAGRPGEDELALLLPETDCNGAFLVAERFRREAEAFFARRESGGKSVDLTVSAGVACYPDDATTAEELLGRAAQALYQAKASGKNAVHLYHPERRRYLRFELEPGRFEVEVLAPADRRAGRPRNLSRNGILFASPEALEVGEEIEIRLAEDEAADSSGRGLRVRGRVVRLEELPAPGADAAPFAGPAAGEDRYEIGVAFDLEWSEGTDDLLDFMERVQARRADRTP